MSSLPSEAGATKLLELWTKIQREERELAHARGELTRINAQKEGLEASLRANGDAFEKQLEAMDCASRGNAGWERRATWLFREMIRQLREQYAAKALAVVEEALEDVDASSADQANAMLTAKRAIEAM